MDQDRGLSVLFEYRPRCVAFLLDLDSATDELVDAVIDFNIDSWGGRFNPIIPTQNGKICPDYWPLLSLSDADIIYSYAELDQETIERLDSECGPIHIIGHRISPSGDRRNYRPSLHEQASTKGLLLQFRELFPGHLRKPKEPSILTFDIEHNDERQISSFVRRNFGVSRNAYFSVRDEGVNPTYPASLSDVDVLECVEKTFNLVLPINFSGKGARRKQAIVTNTDESFTIAYGDHVANAIYYWNRAYFRGVPDLWHSGMNDMWFRPSSLADPTFYSALVKLIGRRVFTSHQRPVKIVSFDRDMPELEELAKRLSLDTKSNLYPDKPERLATDFFPAFSSRGIFDFNPVRPSHEFVKGNRFFVALQLPKDLSDEPQKNWMLKVRVEDSDQEKPFANMEPWWKLPRRQALAGLFGGQSARRSRVAMDGTVLLEVGSGEQTCEIRIPDKHSLFSTLLLPEMRYWTVDDLRHEIPRNASERALASSDKGKYLNGLFSLFGSMSEATYFFEHPFWLGILTELCRPEISEHVKNQVRATIREQAPAFVADFQRDSEGAVAWLTEEMLGAGQRIPRAENTLRLDDLKKKLDTFVAGLTTDFDRHRAADIDLERDLLRLAETGALLQGFEIKCPRCLSRFWYHVNDVKTIVDCLGCRRQISLPVERPWSYKPNELLWKAVRYHGLVPVIRTIRRLFEETRTSFVFVSGIVFYDYRNEPPEATDEIDLVWVKDGEFGMAEIKQSVGLFKTRDCERLISLAKAARPRAVLLAAMHGEDAGITKWAQLVDGALKPLGIRTEAWGPSAFARHSHHVW